MQLIDTWKQSWKFASMIGTAALASFDVIHSVLPTLQGVIPPQTFAVINVASLVGIAIARVIKQESIHAPAPDTTTHVAFEDVKQ
jgi:hypothetical protein